MTHPLAIVSALMFASAAWFGYALSGSVISRRPHQTFGDIMPQVVVTLCLVAGGIVGMRDAAPLHLLGLSLVVVSLVALVRCDLRIHATPPWLSLVPLVAICIVAIIERAYWVPASALLVSLPFASVALMTKGAGMSWSDVRIVALGTSLLGLFPAIIAFSIATLLSAFVQWGLRRRSSIQIAPYLVGAIAVGALAFGG